METNSKISTKQVVIAVFSALGILILSQLIAILIGSSVVMLGAIEALGNAVTAVLYPLLTLVGINMLCKKVLKKSMAECGITNYRCKPVWIIASFLMPMLVIGVLCLMPGHWERGAKQDTIQLMNLLSGAIFFTGMAVGIVEEIVFRGIIMKALEWRWNRKVGIIVPSVLFGAIHVIGNKMSIVSFIQLVLAGSLVGILFSLVTYECGNIWSSAMMHGIWNMFMCSGIIHIAKEPVQDTLYNYILETDSALLSGGEFGIEASVVSIAAYMLFAILAVRVKRKRGEHET